LDILKVKEDNIINYIPKEDFGGIIFKKRASSRS
jgi:hypothetical protein